MATETHTSDTAAVVDALAGYRFEPARVTKQPVTRPAPQAVRAYQIAFRVVLAERAASRIEGLAELLNEPRYDDPDNCFDDPVTYADIAIGQIAGHMHRTGVKIVDGVDRFLKLIEQARVAYPDASLANQVWRGWQILRRTLAESAALGPCDTSGFPPQWSADDIEDGREHGISAAELNAIDGLRDVEPAVVIEYWEWRDKLGELARRYGVDPLPELIGLAQATFFPVFQDDSPARPLSVLASYDPTFNADDVERLLAEGISPEVANAALRICAR